MEDRIISISSPRERFPQLTPQKSLAPGSQLCSLSCSSFHLYVDHSHNSRHGLHSSPPRVSVLCSLKALERSSVVGRSINLPRPRHQVQQLQICRMNPGEADLPHAGTIAAN